MMTNKFKRLFNLSILISLIFLLFSCSNLIEKPHDNSDDTWKVQPVDKGYLTFSITTKNIGRTINPESIVPSDLKDFDFKGTYEGADEITIGHYVSLKDFPEKISIEPGEWTFTLSAKHNEKVYSDTITKTIKYGSNKVAFELKPNGEFGGFELTIDLTEETSVNSVKASLFDFQGNPVEEPLDMIMV